MALTMSERIFLPKYQVAAIGITTFELKVRLLADTDPGTLPHRDAITGNLTELIKSLCDHLKASDEQRAFLVAFAKLRNDILHLKLSKAAEKNHGVVEIRRGSASHQQRQDHDGQP